jgi:GNAT superfamily N-acetyltransferase
MAESEIDIRLAGPDDSIALAELLGHLGYPADPAEMPGRLARLDSGDSSAFVAVLDGAVVGLATVHRRVVLHAEAPVVQLTALVVGPEMRGRGIGRVLVAEAERWAVRFGAQKLVVTTALHRAEAPLLADWPALREEVALSRLRARGRNREPRPVSRVS